MINVADYIDKRNESLWYEVTCSMPVQIELGTEHNYVCRNFDDHAVIYVYGQPNHASFTHELLHLKLYKDGLRAGTYFQRTIMQSATLNKVVSLGTIELVTNCMEHVKMLPLFLQLGYRNEDFISDYDKFKVSRFCLWRLKFNLRYGNKCWAIDHLIGWTIAMKADNNPKHEYRDCFAQIASFAPELYTAISDFWDAWLACDITQRDEWNNNIDFWEETNNFEQRLKSILENTYALKM